MLKQTTVQQMLFYLQQVYYSMQIQNLVESIKNQQRQIEENQQERNLKYKTCMNNFKSYLTDEIHIFTQSLQASEKRNKVFTDQYGITYDRIMTGAQEIIRRMKRTYNVKKDFLHQSQKRVGRQQKEMINEQMDLNQEKYYEAIQNQKMNYINFSKFLQERETDRRLQQQKNKNRMVEDKLTMHNTGWGGFTLKNTLQEPYLKRQKYNQLQSNVSQPKVINQFMRQAYPRSPQNELSRRSSQDRFASRPPIRPNNVVNSTNTANGPVLNRFMRSG